MRPPPLNAFGEGKSIHGTGHINIGKKHLNLARAGLEHGQSDIGIGRFQHMEASLLQIIGCGHPHDRFVLYKQDDRGVL